ncbi:MAG: hypothetical protein L0387_20105 [Acidobacteria bacterium]|nr:hypothetical protein [Acidobacteriota bacterium]
MLPKRLFGPLGYDGHNKTFFFAAYEGLRERSAATLITTVPTEAMRRGDFSQFRNSAGQQIVIYDPTTTVRQGSGFVRQAFPGNIIPQSAIDPVAARIVPFYPLPNGPGDPVTGLRNYAASGTNITDNDSLDVKVDQNLSDRQRFFARYSRRNVALRPPEFFPKEILVAARPNNLVDEPSHSFAFDYNLTVSPTYLLNVRLGANRVGVPTIRWRSCADLHRRELLLSFLSVEGGKAARPGLGSCGGLHQRQIDRRRLLVQCRGIWVWAVRGPAEHL